MKYDPLQRHLATQLSTTRQLSLKFGEIEEILQAKLPKSASTYMEWWANQAHGTQAASWLEAGFIVDRVDLTRKFVQFRRDSATRVRINSAPPKKTTSDAPKPRKLVSATANVLLDAGFKRVGKWVLRDGQIHLTGNIPTEPGVYAHVVDGKVSYIGSATMGLKKRMYFYEKPGKGQSTNLRINPLIEEQLKAGREVELLTAIPGQSTWNGLPVDLVPGLEAGLLRELRPSWNKR